MVYNITPGTTDVSIYIRIIDSSVGTPEQSVSVAQAGMDLEYRRTGASTVDLTEVTVSIAGSHADGGFCHVGNGYYRVDLPDAACAAGVADCLVLGSVTDMIVIGAMIQLGGAIASVKADTSTILTNTSTILTYTSTILTNTSAILTDTGTTLDGVLASVNTYVTNIKADTSATLTAVTSVASVVTDMNLGIIYGSATAGTLTTTQMTTNLSAYANDQLIGRVVIWINGSAAGEAADITDNAATGAVLTYTSITVAPAAGNKFKIV